MQTKLDNSDRIPPLHPGEILREEFMQPLGNRLEKLRGSREGQYSIRINDQYGICFRWVEEDAWEVEAVDYHQE